MRESGSGYFVAALALLLLAVFVLLPAGAGPGALDREMAFWGGLQNSLYHLDQAKIKWMDEKHKTEHDVPSMENLAPYLGDWTNSIKRFVALGVEYQITPVSEMQPQSDVATLTRDLRFQKGFRRYYPAGTRFSLQGDHGFPPYNTKSWFMASYQNNRGWLGLVLFVSAIGTLLFFVTKRIQILRQVREVAHDHQNA